MTDNTTARAQAIELGERLRAVAAWNVRLRLAKEELEQQALCEAAGVTKATIGQNEPRRHVGPRRHRSRSRHPRHAAGRAARRHAV
ncbi:hypothetical protein [Bifidobacterium moukalabense]|uniref:hypothetical protein n=1 Tax=Bifidobacterium moukalabense TaxID=1333651 RepID=UPI00148599FC|nr:hypothetical protein [Bifidobacterium moukalabense]